MGRWPQFLGIFHIFPSYLWLVEAIIDIPRIWPSRKNCGSLLEPIYLVPFESLYSALYTPGIVSPISPVISPCSHQTPCTYPTYILRLFRGALAENGSTKGSWCITISRLSFPSFPIVSHSFLYFHPYFPICSHSFPYVGHNWRVLASSGLAEHFFSGRGMDRRLFGLEPKWGDSQWVALSFLSKNEVPYLKTPYPRGGELPLLKGSCTWLILNRTCGYVITSATTFSVMKTRVEWVNWPYRSGKQGLEDDFTSRHWLQCVFDLTLRWVKIAYPKVDSWSVFLTETCKLLWVIGSHW